MTRPVRFDHVGINVLDLAPVTAFFVGLGFEEEGRTFVEGDFIDVVIGIPGSRTEVVMLRAPGGGTGLELARFVRPDALPGTPDAPPNQLGMRSIGVEVTGLEALVESLRGDGFEMVGGLGDYEGMWRMAHVRGPEGIVVALAERIDASG